MSGADMKGTIWKATLKGLIGLIVIGAAALVWLFFAFDTCLDRGGRWIYEERRCEYCYDRDGTMYADELCERYQPESMPASE